MSRVLKVQDGDYKIVVTSPTPAQDMPTITLDTGDQMGQVVVTGNLLVLGNTTTVVSETVNIKDNIVYINDGESGNGITLDTAGIEIDRGNYDNAQILFDENTNYYSPTLAINKAGTFVFKDAAGLLRGIKTNSITTGGGNLGLINQGTGLVTVTGTQNYHLNVQASSDMDVLVTRAWVEQYVYAQGFEEGQGVAVTDRIYRMDTGIQAYDTSLDGGTSSIKFKFDNTVKATFTSSAFTINTDVNVNGRTKISNNTISADTAGDNLILSPAAGKSIEINGALQLDDTTGPTAVSGSTKLYTLNSSATGSGKTGIYFTSLANSDELVAKNRALLWSMLF